MTGTIRPRRGDLEAATQPHTSVPSGEFVGLVEVCDLCGLTRVNPLMHPDALPKARARKRKPQ
jgi:hypothetical protein